jgi:hypothetical protein
VATVEAAQVVPQDKIMVPLAVQTPEVVVAVVVTDQALMAAMADLVLSS